MNKFYKKQRGVVLFVSLIMLTVIGMMTLTLMGMSRIEMQMANNEETRISGLNIAQAMLDIIVDRPKMTPVVGGAGFVLCWASAECGDMEMPDTPVNDLSALVDDGFITVTATRPDPDFSPPPRGLGWSASKFISTSFNLEATYDRTEEGQGFASVEEGVIVLIPLN